MVILRGYHDHRRSVGTTTRGSPWCSQPAMSGGSRERYSRTSVVRPSGIFLRISSSAIFLFGSGFGCTPERSTERRSPLRSRAISR